MTLPAALVLAASLAAAVMDVRTRRIPNALVIALFVCGFVLSVLAGWQSVAACIGIAAAVLVAGSFAFSLRIIGGGDVKLLAAAAATLGYHAAAGFILYTLLCGGIIAVVYSAMRGRLRATFANVQTIALPMFAGIKPERLSGGTPMPYALAIFAGALVSALANGLPGHFRSPW